MKVAVASSCAGDKGVPKVIGDAGVHARTGLAWTIRFAVIGAGVLKSVVSLGVKVAVRV